VWPVSRRCVGTPEAHLPFYGMDASHLLFYQRLTRGLSLFVKNSGYDQLLAFREQPMPEEAARLERECEALCATVTSYEALDERMAKTHAKQACLLMVLAHPEIPLHNNPAELGARARVRKREVSFGPRTREGANAWDTFMTLAGTATKLGISFYHSIHDRVSGAYQMPALADLIAERAKDLNLGASWDTS